MLTASFKKLSIPPRLNDVLLDPLSVEDHAKYLWFHNRYRVVLETLRRKGAKPRAVVEFGESADWLRAVDHLLRRWNRHWAFAYIHHTYPAHDWPGEPNWQTVDPLTFAFLWFHGVADPATFVSFKVMAEGSYACPVCGRTVQRWDTVLRYGLPTCGCGKRVLRPTPAYVMVSPDFSRTELVDAFRRRCREQRVLDPMDYSGTPQAGIVFGFLDRRIGEIERQLRESAERGLPTFIVGKGTHVVADSSRRGPVVGGLGVP